MSDLIGLKKAKATILLKSLMSMSWLDPAENPWDEEFNWVMFDIGAHQSCNSVIYKFGNQIIVSLR